MNCPECGIQLSVPLGGKFSFRATCDKCGADLHTCKNCKYYKVGYQNDCMVPGTEFVADRLKNNFCEEFSILGKGPEPKDPGAKKRFDDLFK